MDWWYWTLRRTLRSVAYESTTRFDLLGTRALAVIRREIDGQRSYLVIMLIRSNPSEARTLPSYLIVIVPEVDTQPAWPQLVPPLAAAAAIALGLSLALAILLSNSITRPLLAMIAAPEAMSRGDYRQQIPVRGNDEVARLASSFNRMACEVEHSRPAQRDFMANISHPRCCTAAVKDSRP